MRNYRCNKCGKIVKRPQRNGKYPAWLKSYCDTTGKTTRMYLMKRKRGDA